MNPESSAKTQRRNWARQQRDNLSPAVRAAKSQAIVEHIAKHLRSVDKKMTHVALYASMGSEVDVAALLSVCADLALRFFLPRTQGRGVALEFVPIADESACRLAKGGFSQPTGLAIDSADIDLVLVPGLAFDSSGYRLGYGGGYYDRTLGCMPATRLGVAFAVQRLAGIPIEAHDVAVHHIVDENGLWTM